MLLFNVFVTENVGVYTGMLNAIGVSAAIVAFSVVAVPEHMGEDGDADNDGVGGACDTVAIVVNLLEQLLLVAVNV